MSLPGKDLQPLIRCTSVETPIQPDQPFVDLRAQIVQVNLAFAQCLYPIEEFVLAMNFQSIHVFLGTAGVFWRATSGARDTAW